MSRTRERRGMEPDTPGYSPSLPSVGVVIVRFARTITRAWALALGGLLAGCSKLDRSTHATSGPGLGSVVDFIGLPNFPVFNVADMAITCSAVAMIILAWRGIPPSSRNRRLKLDDSNSADSSSNDPRSKELRASADIHGRAESRRRVTPRRHTRGRSGLRVGSSRCLRA